MKLLLGATIALLLGALAMSYNGMKQGVASASPEDRQRVALEIEQIRLEVEKLKAEKAAQDLPPRVPIAPPTPAVPTDAELADLKEQLQQKEAELKTLDAEKKKEEKRAKLFDSENAELSRGLVEKGDPEFRRARLIGQALLVAKVKEYVEDATNGDFVVLDIQMPEQIQAGTILSIRKNSGILGQLKVTTIDPEGAVANLLPGFGTLKPQPGDELIIPPPF